MDERWRDTYDDWKTRSDCDDCPDDECYHEEAELDILTGRACCPICGHCWYPPREQFLNWNCER